MFTEEVPGIYRLKVPFENLYTSVFLVVTESGAVLADCATTAYDADTYIVPALKAMGFALADLDALVLSHKHGDHAGGLPRIRELAPGLPVVTDVRALFAGVGTYPMAGHTEDCIGILDNRTHTLITCDGLQGAGVDKYRCSARDPQMYHETLARIAADERVENLLFSHAYEPWFTDRIFGRQNVLKCLDTCRHYL